MIPKIIHYCWFGTDPIKEEYEGYIRKWREMHPDWEIVKWDETNLPIEQYSYLQNAVNHKCWANMSNFVRLYCLLTNGGIYLDTDVLLVKKLDQLLEEECFFGFEEGDEVDETVPFWVNSAVCGGEKGNQFLTECFELLLKKFDGAEQANLSGPRLITEHLIAEKGLKKYGLQKVGSVTLFPKEYFYPIHYSEVYKLAYIERYLFEETIAVHVWARTWLSKEVLLQIIDDLYFKNARLTEHLTAFMGQPQNQEVIVPLLNKLIQESLNAKPIANAVITSQEASIQRLLSTVEEKEKLIHALQTAQQNDRIAVAGLEQELDRIQGHVKEKIQVIENMQEEVRQLKVKQQGLSTEIESSIEQIRDLTEKNQHLESDLMHLAKANEELIENKKAFELWLKKQSVFTLLKLKNQKTLNLDSPNGPIK